MIVTLITDFGLDDEFAGVMKGVLLTQNPGLTIVDISHAVPPQDIETASLLLAASWPFFPAGTVHAVVVDPTVGSRRKIVVVTKNGHRFIGPDNGVFSPLLDGGVAVVHEVSDSALFLPHLSSTFQGRDIIAPVAARLAAGMPPEKTGPALSAASLVRLRPAAAEVDLQAGCICGRILRVDHFGNLASDVSLADLTKIFGKNGMAAAEIDVNGQTIHGISSNYAAALPGGLLALLDSQGRLEIAARNASAAAVLGAGRGATLRVWRRKKPSS